METRKGGTIGKTGRGGVFWGGIDKSFGPSNRGERSKMLLEEGPQKKRLMLTKVGI